jgi:hypothetical protein
MTIQGMLKVAVGLALTLGLIYCTDLLLAPLHLSVSELKTMSPRQLTVFFETAVILILLAGFVFQELIEFSHRVFRRPKQQSAPWGYLLYVLVAGFGSATAYALFLKVFG